MRWNNFRAHRSSARPLEQFSRSPHFSGTAEQNFSE